MPGAGSSGGWRGHPCTELQRARNPDHTLASLLVTPVSSLPLSQSNLLTGVPASVPAPPACPAQQSHLRAPSQN